MAEPKPKRPRGRPTKLDQTAADTIVQALQVHGLIDYAVTLAGVTRATFHNWIAAGRTQKKGPYRDFFDSVQKAQAGARTTALGNIRLAGKRGAWQAEAWFLERTQPKLFQPRIRVAVAEEQDEFLDKLERRLPRSVFAQVLEVYLEDEGTSAPGADPEGGEEGSSGEG